VGQPAREDTQPRAACASAKNGAPTAATGAHLRGGAYKAAHGARIAVGKRPPVRTGHHMRDGGRELTAQAARHLQHELGRSDNLTI
jgi:hypothetical protein